MSQFLIFLMLLKVSSGCLSNGLGGSGSCGCSSCPCGAASPAAYPASVASYPIAAAPAYGAPARQPASYAPSYNSYEYSNNAQPTTYAKPYDGYIPPPPPLSPGYTQAASQPVISNIAPAQSYLPSNTFVVVPHQAPVAASEVISVSGHPLDAYMENSAEIGTNNFDSSGNEQTEVSSESNTVSSRKPVYGNSMAPLTHASGYNVGEQIQVSSSDQTNEKDGEYLAVLREEPSSRSKHYVTYYNQVCTGLVLGKSSGETIETATKKCALLGCSAANAVADNTGTYEVEYLRDVRSRYNKKSSYCMSLGSVPLRRSRKTSDDNEEEEEEPDMRKRKMSKALLRRFIV